MIPLAAFKAVPIELSLLLLLLWSTIVVVSPVVIVPIGPIHVLLLPLLPCLVDCGLSCSCLLVIIGDGLCNRLLKCFRGLEPN